jgi:nicotinate-nucleotide adenylyltransferase
VIGILGGSFDPVHTAHLAMADAFAAALALDELRFLPASRPWQKDGLMASGEQRSAMLRCALAAHRPAHGRYLVDDRELTRGGKTYTIDTLAGLRDDIGDQVPLVFLFGADQLVHLDTWREWTRLWDYAHLAAVTRPGFDTQRLPGAVATLWSQRLGDARALRDTPAGRAFMLEDLALDVSATDIRAALTQGGIPDPSLGRLVPPAVLDYIRANHLYRS